MCERSILWHQLTELKCLLQAYFENQGVNSSVRSRLKIWRKISSLARSEISLGVGKRFCFLSLRSYWILHHLPFRDLSGAEEYSQSKKQNTEMLRYHKAAKTLCTLTLPHDSDHGWTWQGIICQSSYTGFREEVKGALKPILLGEEQAND